MRSINLLVYLTQKLRGISEMKVALISPTRGV